MMEAEQYDNIDQQNDDLQDQLVIQVDRNQSPLRIDSYLNDRIKNVSRTRIQNGIKSGAVRVNGKQVKSNYRVAPQDEISVVVPHHESYEIIPEDIPLNITYEDEDVLVVNKPAGMVVHPGVGNPRGTLLNGLAYYLKLDPFDIKNSENFSYERLGLVHRIDKETSGLLVIAKTDYSLSHLAKQFFDHTTSRKYIAMVWGEPESEHGTVNKFIGRSTRNRQLYTVYPDGDQGKHAVTHWSMLERLYYVSLLECVLETGRTHQIRVHMQSIGHPVFNDERYGGDKILKGTIYSKYKQFVENLFAGFPRHALHAKTLGFTHPVTGKRMEFDSPLPPEFESLVDKWRNYVKHQKQLQS